MKRGHKITSAESICLITLKSGSVFYSHKKDKDITAIASYYKRKVKTERVLIVNPQKNTIQQITKVILL